MRKQLPKKAKIDYKKSWEGMPEFSNSGLKPVKVLTVNFESKEAMLKFSKLMGQEVTAKTRSIWFPKAEEETAIDKRWRSTKK